MYDGDLYMKKEKKLNFILRPITESSKRSADDRNTKVDGKKKTTDTETKKLVDKGPNKKKIIDWMLIFTAIWCLISLIGYFDSKRNHYNFNFSWVPIEEAVYSMLETDSKAHYIYESYSSLSNCAEGVALVAHYNNQDEYDKTITDLTIHVADIIEDYTPFLSFYYPVDNSSMIMLGVYNTSWSETGDVQVSYQSFGPLQDGYNNYEMPDSLSVKFPQNMSTTWKFESIQPGERKELFLCPLDDLVIDYQGDGEGKVFILKFNISIQKSNWQDTFIFPCMIHNGVIEHFPWPQGGGTPFACGVWIDTSMGNFEKTYSVRQVLPGNMATDIPIFFIPSMSCTMTIQVEFKMDDGHIIKVPPLKNVYASVLYYEGDYYQRLHNGELIDWEGLEGEYAILNDFDEDEYYIGYPFKVVDFND